MRWFPYALVGLGFLAVLAVLPHASAQTFQPSLDLSIQSFPSSALQSDGASGAIIVGWTYTFKETSTALFTTVTGRTTLHWSPAPTCTDRNVIIKGPADTDIQFDGPTGATRTTYSGSVAFNASALTGALGETPIACTFHGQTDKLNSQVEAATAAPVQTVVVVAFFGLIKADFPISISEAAPGHVALIPVEITNLGNAAAIVEVTADGPEAANLQTVRPLKLQRGESATLDLAFTTQGTFFYANHGDVANVHFTPHSTEQPDVTGKTVSENVLVRTRGANVPVVLTVGVLLLAAVALVVVQTRKRKGKAP